MTSRTSIARRLFGEEKALAGVGVLGLVLAAACAGAALVRGSAVVAPGGDLSKPMAFDGAVGLWVLTIAALLSTGLLELLQTPPSEEKCECPTGDGR